MFIITPQDTNKLLLSVHSNYNIDLSVFCYNLLRYRISQFLGMHLLKDVRELIDHLLDDEIHLDKFLAGISAGSSELFRDPGTWKHLREEILPELYSKFSEPVFWLPRSVSGHDAFSLLILLAEDFSLNRCKIYSSASNFSDLKRIQAGRLEKQFTNLSYTNYLESGGKKNLKTYLDHKGDHIKPSLLRKIKFTRQYNLLSGVPDQVNMIVLRNQLLNYTQTFKNNILNQLAEILQPGGILILGIKELIEDELVARKYAPLIADEGIYIKPVTR